MQTQHSESDSWGRLCVDIVSAFALYFEYTFCGGHVALDTFACPVHPVRAAPAYPPRAAPGARSDIADRRGNGCQQLAIAGFSLPPLLQQWQTPQQRRQDDVAALSSLRGKPRYAAAILRLCENLDGQQQSFAHHAHMLHGKTIDEDAKMVVSYLQTCNYADEVLDKVVIQLSSKLSPEDVDIIVQFFQSVQAIPQDGSQLLGGASKDLFEKGNWQPQQRADVSNGNNHDFYRSRLEQLEKNGTQAATQLQEQIHALQAQLNALTRFSH